jgi:hypothetical protein
LISAELREMATREELHRALDYIATVTSSERNARSNHGYTLNDAFASRKHGVTKVFKESTLKDKRRICIRGLKGAVTAATYVFC